MNCLKAWTSNVTNPVVSTALMSEPMIDTNGQSYLDWRAEGLDLLVSTSSPSTSSTCVV